MEMYYVTKVAMSPTSCAAKGSGRIVYIVVIVMDSSSLLCVSLYMAQMQTDFGCRFMFHLCISWRFYSSGFIFPDLVCKHFNSLRGHIDFM